MLLGVLALAASLFSLQQLKLRTHALEGALASRAESLNLPPKVSAPANDNVNNEAAHVAIQQLVIPWASLLKGLEAANQDDVKMVSMTPASKTRSLRMSLIALNKDSMWRYIKNLNQQTALKEVRLISNETVDLNGQTAIAFLVEATWPI